eukprot:TRINITY_DN38883_c0_g1_i1.p1 TRINITY_DN38883_c0_g1~~TRINITY_DN38883_c0_g1_i1.p1  ORF type:complete len:657 (+),score=127.36 TRINITY_DN38883_c0_g1_i1:66-2036(+)
MEGEPAASCEAGKDGAAETPSRKALALPRLPANATPTCRRPASRGLVRRAMAQGVAAVPVSNPASATSSTATPFPQKQSAAPAPAPPGSKPGFFRGRPVAVPAAHAEGGSLPGIEYAPLDEGAEVVGLMLLMPGSLGGLGPGLVRGPHPLDRVLARAARGGLYTRLAQELCSGEEATWEYRRAPPRTALNLIHHPAFRSRVGERGGASLEAVPPLDFDAGITGAETLLRPSSRQPANGRLIPRSLLKASLASARALGPFPAGAAASQALDSGDSDDEAAPTTKSLSACALDCAGTCSGGSDSQQSLPSTSPLQMMHRSSSAPTFRGGMRPSNLRSVGTTTMRKKRQVAIASLQIDWSTCPKGELRRPDILESAVADIEAAAAWLTARYPGRPVVLVSHSFGGPSLWAGARRLPESLPLAGAVSIAGSARGGEQYKDMRMNTVDCVQHFCRRPLVPHGDKGEQHKAGPAVMFLHGTHDKKVALEVSEFLFTAASGPKSFVRVNYGTHGLDTTRDVAYPVLRSWVLAAIERWHLAAAGEAVAGVVAPTASALPPIAQKVLEAPPAPAAAAALDVEDVAGELLEIEASAQATAAHAEKAEGRVVSLDAGIVSVGHPLRLLADEVTGSEHWRLAKTEGRLERACRGLAKHPLAGLLGYSE